MDREFIEILKKYGLEIITDPNDERFEKGLAYNADELLHSMRLYAESQRYFLVGPSSRVVSVSGSRKPIVYNRPVMVRLESKAQITVCEHFFAGERVVVSGKVGDRFFNPDGTYVLVEGSFDDVHSTIHKGNLQIKGTIRIGRLSTSGEQLIVDVRNDNAHPISRRVSNKVNILRKRLERQKKVLSVPFRDCVFIEGAIEKDSDPILP